MNGWTSDTASERQTYASLDAVGDSRPDVRGFAKPHDAKGPHLAGTAQKGSGAVCGGVREGRWPRSANRLRCARLDRWSSPLASWTARIGSWELSGLSGRQKSQGRTAESMGVPVAPCSPMAVCQEGQRGIVRSACRPPYDWAAGRRALSSVEITPQSPRRAARDPVAIHRVSRRAKCSKGLPGAQRSVGRDAINRELECLGAQPRHPVEQIPDKGQFVAQPERYHDAAPQSFWTSRLVAKSL